MKFQRHLDGFRDYLRAHHFAARTLETYGANTKRFLAFLEQRHPRIDTVEQVTKDTILHYQRHLAEHEDPRIGALTHATQNLILRSVRKFFHYLLRGDFILRDPTSVLEFPKEEQKLIRNVLSEDEVSGLLEQIKPIGPEGLRNRAIVELLYACGIRTTELCRLRVADVDLKEQTVTIMKGKGGKSRVVPIGQYACHYIAEYLRKGRKYFLRGRTDDPGLLFLSGWGNPFNASTINRSVMWKIAAEVGLKKDLTCYTFRHSVATHMLRNEANVMFIAKLLGHASMKTTQKRASRPGRRWRGAPCGWSSAARWWWLVVLFPERPADRQWGPGSRLAYRSALYHLKPTFVAASQPPVAPAFCQLAPADLFATVDGYWVVPHTFRDGLCDDEY